MVSMSVTLPNAPVALQGSSMTTHFEQPKPQITRPAGALCLSLPRTRKQRPTVGWTHGTNITLLYLPCSEAACTQELKGRCVREAWERKGVTARGQRYNGRWDRLRGIKVALRLVTYRRLLKQYNREE